VVIVKATLLTGNDCGNCYGVPFLRETIVVIVMGTLLAESWCIQHIYCSSSKQLQNDCGEHIYWAVALSPYYVCLIYLWMEYWLVISRRTHTMVVTKCIVVDLS
jgi:hypothetical protein